MNTDAKREGARTFGALGAAFSLPWCCIAPALLAALGAAGVGVARQLTVGLMPLFLAVSVLVLGRAHYLIWRGHGRRATRLVVWVSTAFAATLWFIRL
ncbi:MAG: hypothetical protein ACE5I7_16825 [Candidatus Binatia bacterium]